MKRALRHGSLPSVLVAILEQINSLACIIDDKNKKRAKGGFLY